MIRRCLIFLVALAFILSALGCDKKPQKPRQEPPAETGSPQTQPDAEQPPADTGQADQTDAGQAEQAAECPEPRDYQGMCAQVITWASSPESGQCCQYGSPCEAPQGWQTFSSETACAEAGGQTER